MAVSPSGILSLPLDYLRTTIANSSTFRTWTSSASVAAAKARVYLVESAAPTYPFALVGWKDGMQLDSEEGGARNFFRQDGSLELLFRSQVSDAFDSDDVYSHLNNVGAILQEMAALAGQAGYLDIRRMTAEASLQEASRIEQKTATHFLQSVYVIEFGGASI